MNNLPTTGLESAHPQIKPKKYKVAERQLRVSPDKKKPPIRDIGHFKDVIC